MADGKPTSEEIKSDALDKVNDEKFRALEVRVKALEDERGINSLDTKEIRGSSEGPGFATQDDRIGELKNRMKRIEGKNGVAEELGLANPSDSAVVVDKMLSPAQQVELELSGLEARVKKAEDGPRIDINNLSGIIAAVAGTAGAGDADVAKDMPKTPEQMAKELKELVQSGNPLTDEQKAALKDQMPAIRKMIDALQDKIPDQIDAAADKGDMKEVKKQTQLTNGRVNKHQWQIKAFWWALGILWSAILLLAPMVIKFIKYEIDLSVKESIGRALSNYNIDVQE